MAVVNPTEERSYHQMRLAIASRNHASRKEALNRKLKIGPLRHCAKSVIATISQLCFFCGLDGLDPEVGTYIYVVGWGGMAWHGVWWDGEWEMGWGGTR